MLDTLSLHSIQQINLSKFVINTNNSEMNISELLDKAGKQHYKLLAYLTTLFNDKEIINITTDKGESSLALSYNTSNKVFTIHPQKNYIVPDVKNISYHIENIFDISVRERWATTLLNSPLIFVDVDPHDGVREYDLYMWLKEKKYKGIVVFDDIWYFKDMRDKFWYRIPTEDKLDVTHLAHWSGTGIVKFGMNTKTDDSWTLVTAYFDLTKMSDASPSIKGRPSSHYLQHANATLALDYNMVVFCEQENLDAIKAKRPEWLQAKTKYIIMDFEQFPLTQHRNRIIQNRKEKGYRFDDRNTASYYLFCMSRYAMCKKVMDENPFGSERFAWINICIERMGYKNLMELDSVFSARRDKVSTCYIDYIPRELTLHPDEYFRNGGRCSLCSGFFTGHKNYFYKFCDAVEKKFMEYLEAGHGHADEQLFSPVYFENRDIFEVYYGDYTEMITNYNWIKSRAGEPLRLLIRGSYNANDYETCLPACAKLWESVKKGYAELSGNEISELIRIYRGCLNALGKGEELP